VLRRKPPEAGRWSLPGGKVDFLERVEDAIIREVGEESCVAIALSRQLLVSQLIGADGQHWVSPVHLAAIVSVEPEDRELDKAGGVARFALDNPLADLSQTASDAIEATLYSIESGAICDTIPA
jgi:ADP-ribose pyrophosphatase